MKNIKKIIPVFVLISLFSLLFVAWSDLEKQPEPTISITCNLSLQVFTRRGTNAKYNVSGQVVVVDSPNSKFDGNLYKEKESTSYPITLYFDGPVVHFVISTNHGRIFGKGTSEGSLKSCSGQAGGTQSGPTLDDEGNWRGKWSRKKETIPPPPYKLTVIKWVCIGLLIAFVGGLFIGKRSTKNE